MTIGCRASLLPVKHCITEQDDFVTSSDTVSKHVGYTSQNIGSMFCLCSVLFIFVTETVTLRTKNHFILLFCY